MTRTLAALFIPLLLMCFFALVHAQGQPARTQSSNDPSSYTPQEAYDRALHLLRSTTVAYQQAKTARRSSAGSGKDASSTGTSSRGTGHAKDSALSRAWRALQASTFSSSANGPLGALARCWTRLSGILYRTVQAIKYSQFFVAQIVNLITGAGGVRGWQMPDGGPGGAGGALAGLGGLGGGLGRRGTAAGRYSSEHFYVTTGVDGDAAAADAAGRWPGARPRQLWPNWEHHPNEALFGPFVDGAGGSKKKQRSYTDRVFLAARDVVLGKRSKSGEEDADALSTKAGLSRRGRKVQEAVRLLEWVAYSDPSTDPSSSSQFSAELSPADLIAATLAEPYNGTAAVHQPDLRSDALWVLGEHFLWGTHGAPSDVPRARTAFRHLADTTGNSSAHGRLGFLSSSRWQGTDRRFRGEWNDGKERSQELLAALDAPPETPHQQAEALLHYDAAAFVGNADAQIALAYRYHAGIGTDESCAEALRWYELAADQAYDRFISGPPGGLTIPYTKIRLSDVEGGVYGPGASAASTGWAARRPAMQAVLNSRPGSGSESDARRVGDMLEFYTYHAENGEPSHMLVLAKIFYHGSLWGPGETAGAVPRDYKRVITYLLRIASKVWYKDSALVRRGGPAGSVAKRGEPGEDVRLPNIEDKLAAQAGAAAGMLGRMYLRGEGVPQDFYRAWVWYSRGVEHGDAESHNGLGIMLRDGLGVTKDLKRAAAYFEAAASNHVPHADSCVNLAKIMYDMGELTSATKWFRVGLTMGNPFEAFYYLAKLAAHRFETTSDADSCRSATNGFKRVVERGDWDNPVFHVAERAWRTGHREKALLGWMMAGERGYEAAQNNVAWILDRDKRLLRLPLLDSPQPDRAAATDRVALLQWSRSAAQDNVDALVKLGDYYFRGYGTTPSYAKAASCYQAAADRQSSALAYWNMGWMYEAGLGVPRQDFYLAKRYYDMAWEINQKEAYFAVMLSLIRLHARALWATVVRGDSSALNLWSSYAGSGAVNSGMAYSEAEEVALERSGAVSQPRREQVLEQKRAGGDDFGDPNLPESYNRRHFDDEPEGDSDWRGGGEGSIEGLLLVAALSTLSLLVFLRQRVQLRLRAQVEGAAAEPAQENRDGAGGEEEAAPAL